MIERQISTAAGAYTLRFSARAMKRLQDHWQLASLSAVGERLQADLGVDDLAAIWWSFLATHHPQESVETAITILDEIGIVEGTSRAMALIQDSLPAPSSEPSGGDDPLGGPPSG